MISLKPALHEDRGRPRGNAMIALLIAAFGVLAAVYAGCIAEGWLAFNSGAWVVGDDTASRGWLGYVLFAFVHFAASAGLWRGWRWARWLCMLLLGAGLLPAVPGVSMAVMELRIGGIVGWGALIVVRCAGIYMLMNAE